MKPTQRIYPAYLLALLLAVMATTLTAQSPALESVFTIDVYTEVRNNSELTRSASGESVVDNAASRLLAALLAAADIDYTLHVYPWARIQQGLDTDANVLAYPVTRTAAREQRWHWVGEIQPLRYYLYGHSDQSYRLPLSLDAARDLRVGTIQGDVIDTYLAGQGFSQLVHMTDISRAPLMLVRDRFDLFAMGAHRIPQYAELHGIDSDSLVPVVPLTEISTALFFALSRNSDPQLLARLRSAYQTIVADGSLAQIMGTQLAPP